MPAQQPETTEPHDPTSQVDLGTVRRAVTASAMGNAMEWYDYGVFTSGAITTTIGAEFFPGAGGNAALKSFTLLALSFIVRPFGGAVFGPLGDKIGRQRVLVMTILLMSGGTFLVGVIPTFSGAYSLGYGAMALIIFLRLAQGFSTGGEYGGAATFMAEYAPTRRRGFFGSFLEFGTLSGYVLGNIVVLAVTLGIGPGTPAFHAWGWRIPFLIALPLGLVGMYMRLKLEDTPTFEALGAQRPKKAPFREALTHHWRMILVLVGIVMTLNIADYTVLTTMPTYFSTELHYSTTTSTAIIIGVELLMMAVISPLGALSDRIGRKPLLLTMTIGYIVLSYPAFVLMHTHSLAGLVAGFVIVALLLVLILAVIGSTFPAMFPTRVRYGSFSIAYNVSTSVFGGTAGLIITSVISITGNTYVPAYYLILAGAIGVVPILLLPETARVPMFKINTGRPLAGARESEQAAH